jgi:EthD domain
MIKVIVQISKRHDLTAEQFRHHYETVHAPLVTRLLPYYLAYRRNYIEGLARGGTLQADCDVFTELEFSTEADYDAWLAELSRPEVIAQIRADEANFIEAGRTRMWRVATCATE